MTDTDPYMRNEAGSGSEKHAPDEPLRDVNENNGNVPLTDAENVAQIASKRVNRKPYTHLGLAERIHYYNRDRLHYVEGLKWHGFDGRFWTPDDERIGLLALIKATVRETARDLGTVVLEGTKDEGENYMKWLRKCEDKGYTEGAIAWLKSEPGVTVPASKFDSDPLLYNAANGTIDLRTGDMREFRREDYLTKIGRIRFDPNATCERFLMFLNKMFDGKQADIDELQRAMGYSLTGEMSEQKFFMLYGSGQNGKSTLLSTVRNVMGADYAGSIASSVLMSNRQMSDNNVQATLAKIRAYRMITSTEVKGGAALDESLLKDITGEEPISACLKYSQPFTYMPSYKVWLSVNSLPNVSDHTIAMWRRVELFDLTVTIPEKDRDRKLLLSLKRESSGILNWLIEGCLKWQKEGLKPPESMTNAVSDYKDSTDTIGQFLAETCVRPDDGNPVPSHGYTVAPSALYERYLAWMSMVETTKPLPVNQFTPAIKAKGFVQRKTKSDRMFIGLALR